MWLRGIGVKNFRLLREVSLSFEGQTTVIVGRNNSGKTSLTELFRRLLKDSVPSFRLEDFSLAVHEHFWDAFLLKKAGKSDDEVRQVLPRIEVQLTVEYGKSNTAFGSLSEFIIDLNPDCTRAEIVITFQAKPGEIDTLFKDIQYQADDPKDGQIAAFCREMKERVPRRFDSLLFAVDPNDPTNKKEVDWQKLRTLLHGGFINAQRGLDDVTHRDSDVLGKILEALFRTATVHTADPKDKAIAMRLEEAVDNIQQGIDQGFTKQLEDLLPAFSLFGYPGLADPKLSTETRLDVQKLLTDYTKVHYAGINGINLPESYNGLGVRNLIFILLKLLEFYKSFLTREALPGVHLVFIEEPEVHLHPQMQEVFITKLGEIAKVFGDTFNNGSQWPVQFVVTTHSSHLANKASFDSMRYFLAAQDKMLPTTRSTQVKDLRIGLAGEPKEALEFLHKYMTLTRCDLLFADKAVLIEGTTERLMLPKMIQKLDENSGSDRKLASQYLSIVEVGGAYAHLFFGLTSFLEVKTLVITDLDSVNVNDNRRACKVSLGTNTSNACIKEWAKDKAVSITALLGKSSAEKVSEGRRMAFQVPEEVGGACGRSFEDAFALANVKLFGLDSVDAADLEERAWGEAQRVAKKSDFALRFAIIDTDWSIPLYIKEGLEWLLEGPNVQPAGGTVAGIAAPAKKEEPGNLEVERV